VGYPIGCARVDDAFTGTDDERLGDAKCAAIAHRYRIGSSGKPGTDVYAAGDTGTDTHADVSAPEHAARDQDVDRSRVHHRRRKREL